MLLLHLQRYPGRTSGRHSAELCDAGVLQYAVIALFLIIFDGLQLFGTCLVMVKTKATHPDDYRFTHYTRFNKPKEDVMKAKNNFSVLLAETTAKGSLAIFAGVAVFLGGFITWSAAGAISGLASLFN